MTAFQLEYLYHYFDRARGPLRSLTALPFAGAGALLRARQAQNPRLVNPHIDWYLTRRYADEKTVREQFSAIGGRPARAAPVYCTLGPNENMKTWFDNVDYIRMPVSAFDPDTVSFTYGDMFAVFNPALDIGEEWWGKVYRYEEIVRLVEKYGLPEDPVYDMKKWIFPKDRPINQYLKYVEAQVWSDEALDRYR